MAMSRLLKVAIKFDLLRYQIWQVWINGQTSLFRETNGRPGLRRAILWWPLLTIMSELEHMRIWQGTHAVELTSTIALRHDIDRNRILDLDHIPSLFLYFNLYSFCLSQKTHLRGCCVFTVLSLNVFILETGPLPLEQERRTTARPLRSAGRS